MLRPPLLTALAVTLAIAPAAGASPRAHSAAAERAAEASVEQAEDLLDGEGVRTGRELTDALREVSRGLRHLRGADRERAIGLLARPTDDLDPDAFDPSLTVRRDCSANFCVGWVASGPDAATATDVARTLVEAEAVHAFETGTLGWREPPSDGDGRVDVYLKELGSQKLFGYASTDAGQPCCSQSSYLVIDNDFDADQYGGIPALESLRVTLAHEYGHVLQYGYDVTADGWHYEASAVWLEQRMHPDVKDWLRFVQDRASGDPGWRSLTELPLTAYAQEPAEGYADPRNAKPYGSVVWNDFLSARYGAAGDALQRRTWETSDGLERPSTAAYDSAIREAGGRGLSADYAAFAAAVAEWRAAGSPFPDAQLLPDVERRDSLAVDGAPVAPSMDHLSFALYDVPATAGGAIRLGASFPVGMPGALALVARSGSIGGGQVTTRLVELPRGGAGGVTLEQPGRFYESGGRVTAVLVNTDASEDGWSDRVGDWLWSRDQQRVAARIMSTASAPTVVSRSPGPDATDVSPRSPIRMVFSEPVAGVDGTTFVLRRPNGRKVPATVTYAAATRTATLTPAAELADTTRYTVRVGGSILNGGAIPVAQTDWSFTTVRRAPRAKLTTTRSHFRLRSRDRDRLRWTATLRKGGRAIATRRGGLRPGARRKLRLPRHGYRGRARLVVKLRDPQGNATRLRAWIPRAGRSSAAGG